MNSEQLKWKYCCVKQIKNPEKKMILREIEARDEKI